MVDKVKAWQKPPIEIDNAKEKRGYQSKASVIMVILAVGTMLFIGFRNLDTSWGVYALMQAGFGAGGYIVMQLITGQGIIPKEFPTFDSYTLIKVGNYPFRIKYLNNFVYAVLFGLAITVLGQVLVAYKLTISTTEQALYFLFASVCEEMLFRGLLIELFTIIDNLLTQILAISASAILFVVVHVNYYGSAVAIVSVIILGATLAVDYTYFRNITACIIVHFIINIIGTVDWLISL